jgi:hypothetical protein
MTSPALLVDVDEENPLPVKVETNREKHDEFLVRWDENEAANPRNWSTPYRAWVTFLLGMLALAASLGSSIISPAQTAIQAYTGTKQEVTVLCISLYM